MTTTKSVALQKLSKNTIYCSFIIFLLRFQVNNFSIASYKEVKYEAKHRITYKSN